MKTLAGEIGPAGIRVNGILPVRVATDRVRELDALAGDPDAYTTGAMIPVDGGAIRSI